jgi:hypothetical protein
MGYESRKQKRVKLDLPVRVFIHEGDQRTEAESLGKLHDLSAGGCAFRNPREIPIGTRVEVHITLSEQLQKKFNKPELIGHGAICRIERHEDSFVLSVRFFQH